MAEVTLFEFQDYLRSNNEIDRIRVTWDEVTKDILVRSLGYRGRLMSSGSDYPLAPHIGKDAEYRYIFTLAGQSFLKKFKGIATFPYADEYNAQVDTPTPGCDIAIAKVELTHESQLGKDDGTATIQVSSSNPGREYSLDGEVWQTRNTFTGLAAGNYTVYVRDSKDCTTEQTFVIKSGKAISYGLMYFLDFSDPRDKPFTFRVLAKNFDGVEEAVCGNNAPIVPDYSFGSGERFKTIIASTLNVTLVAMVPGQFRNFFTYDERQYLGELWDRENNTRVWSGFAIPDMYSEPWTATPNEITLTFIDGLSTLKDRYFLDGTGKPYHGKHTAFQILRMCLRPMNLDLGYRESISVYPIGADMSGNVSPLDQLIEDVGQYYNDETGEPDTLETVIYKILSPLWGQLIQCLNVWWIHQVNWRVYQEDPNQPPPPPNYGPISFDIYGAKAVAVPNGFEGQLHLINLKGGDPADGAYEYSHDEQTWLPVSGLPRDSTGYLITGLSGNASAVIYLRRPGKPDDVASRLYAITLGISDHVVFMASYNGVTKYLNVKTTRKVAESALTVNYQIWRVNVIGMKEEIISSGSIAVPAGNLEHVASLPVTLDTKLKYFFTVSTLVPETNHAPDNPIHIGVFSSLPAPGGITNPRGR